MAGGQAGLYGVPPGVMPQQGTVATMRLGTLNTDDGQRAVALREGELIELPGSVRELLAAGPDAQRRALDRARRSHRFEPARLGPAVADPGKVLCIGRNYAEHVRELGGEVAPARPEVFIRCRTSLAGPYQPVKRPRVSEQMDWEVELAVVIGRPGRYVTAGRAMEHVAGYCVFDDISFRDFQNAGRQWTPGKNFDGSGPLGPFLVTADEAPDPFHLDLTSRLVDADGGERVMQRSNTSLMIRPIPELIEFVSLFTTLEPGDVIATGTPGGVGFGRRPPVWMRPGETIVCSIEGLGELKNKVVEES